MQGRGLEPGRVTGDEEQRACVAPDARDSALVRSERRRGREDEELIELVAGDHLAHREAGAVGARAQRELDRISASVPVGRRGRRGERVRSVSSIESPRAYLWGGEGAVVSTGMQPLCSIESPRAYPPFTPVFRASSRAIWSGGTWSELSSGYVALALAPPPTTSVQQSVSTAATSSRAPPDALR